MGAAAIDVGLHVDGDLVGYALDDGARSMQVGRLVSS